MRCAKKHRTGNKTTDVFPEVVLKPERFVGRGLAPAVSMPGGTEQPDTAGGIRKTQKMLFSP